MTHGPIQHCSTTHPWTQHVSLGPWNTSRKVKYQIHFSSLWCWYGIEVGVLFYSKNSVWLVKDRRIFTIPNRNTVNQSQRYNSTTIPCVDISHTQHVIVLEEFSDATQRSNKCTAMIEIPVAVQFDMSVQNCGHQHLLLYSAPCQENNWRRIKDLRFLDDGLVEAETSLAQIDRLSAEKYLTTYNATIDTLRTAWKEIYVQLLFYVLPIISRLFWFNAPCQCTSLLNLRSLIMAAYVLLR